MGGITIGEDYAPSRWPTPERAMYVDVTVKRLVGAIISSVPGHGGCEVQWCWACRAEYIDVGQNGKGANHMCYRLESRDIEGRVAGIWQRERRFDWVGIFQKGRAYFQGVISIF